VSSREMFEAARRAIPLPEIWARYNLPLSRKNEGRFASPYTPCCGTADRDDAGSLFIRRDGTWAFHCFRCGKGGSVIDLVAKMEGITPTDAARKLVGDVGGIEAITGRPPPTPRARTNPESRRKAVAAVIHAIEGYSHMDRMVAQYLHETRGLSEAVVAEARERKFLRCLPGFPDSADTWLRLNISEQDLHTSGLQKMGANAPKRAAAAYRPVVFLPPGDSCIEFRTISVNPSGPKALQYGEQRYPLVWKPLKNEVRKIMVVEGGYDVLAAVDLGFAVNTLIVGQFGTSAWNPKWSESLRAKYPHALWQIASDFDSTGASAYDRFAEQLDVLGAKHERLTPWGGGNDWNDTLLAARSF